MFCAAGSAPDSVSVVVLMTTAVTASRALAHRAGRVALDSAGDRHYAPAPTRSRRVVTEPGNRRENAPANPCGDETTDTVLIRRDLRSK